LALEPPKSLINKRDSKKTAPGRGRLHTWGQTAKAFGEKALQSAGAWIAADIGLTFGRALIPIGPFPLGGILLGALIATLVAKGIEKSFKRDR
jgi:hypothetical protein